MFIIKLIDLLTRKYFNIYCKKWVSRGFSSAEVLSRFPNVYTLSRRVLLVVTIVANDRPERCELLSLLQLEEVPGVLPGADEVPCGEI